MQLPDIRRAQGLGTSGPSIRAGSWWRLAAYRPDLEMRPLRAGALPPETPLTLLVEQVRIHDGDLHSIHLAAHPAWKDAEPVKVMADVFLADFVEVPATEAEARRQREIDALMGRSQELSRTIAQGPAAEEIRVLADGISARKREDAERAEARRLKEEAMRRAKAEAKAEGLSFDQVDARGRAAWAAIPERVPLDPQKGSGQVPMALLPGGDILAVQERLSAEITRMEAMGEWVGARSKEMTETMSVVGRFQAEKVQAMTASISDRTRQAEAMMANVETMKLFLGDEVELWRALEGNSAPPEERLHLMQSMLYLDEEILVEEFFGTGLRHEGLSRLPEILAAHPGLVERMLPHPRCVAIARVRRKEVVLDIPEGTPLAVAFQAMMNDLALQDLDKRIFVLVRDGDNLSVVTADAQTSQAERLFPSRAEIDALYTARGRDGQAREIAPQDIEYSDRRNAHDNRALFYKRFLLLLWGLHEREGVFGPFMPKGMNWLEESVSDRFTYVHDEENVLTTGRMPVGEWLERGNQDLRPGSEILVDTTLAFTMDFAPTAWKEGDSSNSYRSWRTRRPREDIVRAIVARSGDDLVVTIPSLSGWRDREVNTPLIVRNADGEHPRGILNLGTATPARLRDYMDSRLERKSYLDWFRLFHAGLPILDERHAEEAPVRVHIMEAGVDEEAATRAIALFRETVRGRRLPESDAEIARVRLNARAFAAPQAFDGEGVLGVRLRADGKIVRLRAAAPRHGVPLQALKTEMDGRHETMPFSAINPRGEALILGGDRLTAHLDELKAMQVPGLVFPRDMEALEAADGAAALAVLDARMTRSDALWAAEAFVRRNMTGSKVTYPVERFLAGAAIIPTRMEDRGAPFGTVRTRGEVVAFCVSRRSMATALRDGHGDIVLEAVKKVVSRHHVIRAMNQISGPDAQAPWISALTGSGKTGMADLLADTNLPWNTLKQGFDGEFLDRRHRGKEIADPLDALLLALARKRGSLALEEAVFGDVRRRIVFLEQDALSRIGSRFMPRDDGPEPA